MSDLPKPFRPLALDNPLKTVPLTPLIDPLRNVDLPQTRVTPSAMSRHSSRLSLWIGIPKSWCDVLAIESHPTDYYRQGHTVYNCPTLIYSVSQPPSPCGFPTFFPIRLGIFNQFFTHLLHVTIYIRLQIFIQLSPTLTKLYQTKRDHLASFYISL